ncbi:programmed cell death protein 7-like isoform X2 [Oscarella lobularis]
MPDDEWEEGVSQVASVKKSLESVESQLSDPTVLESLQRRRARNRRKKAYLKRRRDREEAEEEREKAQWEEKHREIDEWRAKRIATNIAKAREASVKLEAGETLSEVKLKQKDAQEMLEMLSTLKELRSIRREVARRKGKTQPAECDELFAKKIAELETFAKDLQLVYGQEEKTLRVMMEEEGEAVEQEQLRLVQETTQREQGSVIEEANSHEQPITADPMKPFIDYYAQADWRLDSLIGIRHVWDSYVVPSDFPGSSRIPDGWVVPVQPSSKAWEAFLGADSEAK